MVVKELDFRNPNNKDTLVSGLNFYSANFDFGHSKKWALDWLKKNDAELYNQIIDAKDNLFSNRGFVCRMIERGLKVEKNVVDNLMKFFREIPFLIKKAPVESVKQTPRKKEENNQIVAKLEDLIDQVLNGEEIEWPDIPFTNEKAITSAKGWCEKELIFVKDQITKYQTIEHILNQAYTECGGNKEKIQGTRKTTPVKRKPKEVTPSNAHKMVKNVKYLEKDPETGIESMNPVRIIGAKEVLLYNTKYRNAIKIVAATGETLTVTGTTIKNVNPEKCTSKSVKNYELFTHKSYFDGFNQLKSKERPANSRLNENTIILGVK